MKRANSVLCRTRPPSGTEAEINNEAKARRSTKSQSLGEARVMSYEGLEKARAERAAKEAVIETKKAEKEAKRAEKEAKKSTKEVEEVASAIPEVKEVTAGRKKLGQKKTIQRGKSPKEAGVPEPKAKVPQMDEARVEIAPGLWRAPVAQMW